MRGSRLAVSVVLVAALAGALAQSGPTFSVDRIHTFLPPLSHGDSGAGVHELITQAAVRRGLPSAPRNLVTNLMFGTASTDLMHHFDGEYHFDLASTAANPTGFTRGFEAIARHLAAAEKLAKGNAQFLKPTYRSLREIRAELDSTLAEIGSRPDCTACSSLKIKGHQLKLTLMVPALKAYPSPDPHEPTNPRSLLSPNPPGDCGLCGSFGVIGRDFPAIVDNVEAAAAYAVKISSTFPPTDPLRRKAVRLYQAVRAYRAYFELGHAFHATQDFFAHSNYVELMAGVAVGDPIPAGTAIPLPATFADFSPAGLRQLMGSDKYSRLETGAVAAFWLNDGDYCLDEHNPYNPDKSFATRLVSALAVFLNVDPSVKLTGGTNPNPPDGFHYCHYATPTTKGLHKDDPDTVNHPFARQAAIGVSTLLWTSFLQKLGGGSESAPSASLTGDWNVDFSFSTAPNAYQRFPGTWTWRQNGTSACVAYSGSGGGKGQGAITKLADGRLQLSGSSTDKDFGTSTFTLTLTKDGSSFSGDWKRDNLSGKWRGTRAGPPSRSC